MANISPALLSDRDLLDATVHANDRERRTTAELLALLAELDTRKLYLGAVGLSSRHPVTSELACRLRNPRPQ